MQRPLLLALVLAAALVSSARAQTASKQLQQGIEAYARLDLETAARLLRRALAFPPDGGLSREQRDTALTYLGTAELFRQRRDSSAAAFHRRWPVWWATSNPTWRPRTCSRVAITTRPPCCVNTCTCAASSSGCATRVAGPHRG